MIPVELTKAILDGYFFHDYSRWKLQNEQRSESILKRRHSIHIGYGISLICDVELDKEKDMMSFQYILYGDQRGDDGSANRFKIEDLMISIDDEEILIPYSGYIVTIKHEKFDIDSYLKSQSRKTFVKYAEMIYGEDEKRYRRLPELRDEEYAGLPDYRRESSMMSDKVMDILLRSFEMGDVSVFGPWEMNENGKYQFSINISGGYSLVMCSDEKDIYLDELDYSLVWTSSDGDMKISVVADHLTAKNNSFRIYGERCEFDIYIGYARLEDYFKQWRKRK